LVTDWIDIEFLKAACRHTICCLVLIVFFAVISHIIDFFLVDQVTRDALHVVDGIGLVGLFIWLLYQMGCEFWNRRVRIGSNKMVVLA